MRLGFVASKFSLSVGLEEVAKEEGEQKPEIGSWAMIGSMVVSIGFFLFMYKGVHSAAASRIKSLWHTLNNNFAFTLVAALIRIALFLLFICANSLWADIKRVYRY